MGRALDLSGLKFGLLTAIDSTPSHRGRLWRCRCDCGGERTVIAGLLRGNQGKRVMGCASCIGGRRSEFVSTHGESRGKKHSKLYTSWHGMMSRCLNRNYPTYKYYGGKGVEVHPDWKRFEGFRDWAVANGYRDGLTIDRVNSCDGYQPDNCEWVTMKENVRRMRTCYWRSMTVNA